MRALTLLAAASLLAAWPVAAAGSVPAPAGLLAAIGADASDPLAYAVHLGKEGTRHQARLLGVDLGAVRLDVPMFDRPSDALFVLAAGHGVEPTPDQRAQILALDALGGAIPAALAQTVNAFLAYEAATRAAFEGVTIEDFERGTSGPNPFAAAGVDVAPILAARLLLLDAAIALRDALPDETGPPAVTGCGGISVVPAFTIDLATCSNGYGASVALQIDAGGEDDYDNNAGGSNLVGACEGAAALFDFGSGNDTFGEASYGCGQNGGGHLGSGFLLAEAGSDVYLASDLGTNGGGVLGLGFLLDAGGHDAYEGTSRGTNGGGNLGAGILVDVGGDDLYLADGEGANGGGWSGPGLLLDAGPGNDFYSAGSLGVNGGAGFSGVGTLLDADGDDTYHAGAGGVNGGALSFATALLVDLGGTDFYSDAEFGSAYDRSIAPKGLAGAQLDVTVGSIPAVPVGAVPTGAPVLGPDADADGVPRHVDFSRSDVTLGGPSLLTLGPASPLRVDVDPDDSDRCNPACVPTATTPVPSGATLGPDADGDGLPAYVDVRQLTVTVHGDGTVTTAPGSPARFQVDSADDDPDVRTAAASVRLPAQRVDVGPGNVRLACAGVEQVDTPGATLEGAVQMSVPGRSIAEPTAPNALRCTALGFVPRSV